MADDSLVEIHENNQLFTPSQDDWNLIDEMLAAQADGTEIAGYFGISQKTLKRHIEARYGVRFVQYKAAKRGKGRVNVRLYQYRQAQSNPQLSVHWSKQYMGHSDKVSNDHYGTLKTESTTPLTFEQAYLIKYGTPPPQDEFATD